MHQRINLHKVPNDAPSTITETRENFEEIFNRNRMAHRASKDFQDIHSSRGSLAVNEDYAN